MVLDFPEFPFTLQYSCYFAPLGHILQSTTQTVTSFHEDVFPQLDQSR